VSEARRPLPSGTLTFVFTDIEQSTALVDKLGTTRFNDVLEEHGRTLRSAFGAAGVEVRTEGDAFFFVFTRPTDAVAAAVDAQQALARVTWPHAVTVRVRVGLHTGEAVAATADAGDDYVGFDVHRAARIAGAGHGGQVLISETTRALVQDRLPPEVTLRDLGPHRFKDLREAERVYQLVIPGLPAEFPALRSLNRTPNNLPTPVTSFIGRERELDEGRRLLAGTRLLTLTGPGGTGKTRLSIQIAAASSDDFADGVFFVPLAPIVDPGLVATTIAHTMGISLAGTRPAFDELSEALRDKTTLLVLDNFEQIQAAATQVNDLLKAAPRLKLLVTSRGALRVYGEQEMPVPPLALPDAGAQTSPEALTQYEAVRLFIERARATRPDFKVTSENAPAVAGICARLDGLPLAIELAAARVGLLTPQKIYERLENSLSALGSGPRDLPARQQTLRGAISWSYDLLDEGSRRLLRRMACFAGGAALDQIEAVCGPADDLGIDVLEGVEALVAQSLLRQRESDGEPRFWMLQTIREYARERLDETPEAQQIARRHACAYLALAEDAAPHLLGVERKRRLDGLEAELDNFRGGLEWAIATKATETALRMVAALWRFWQMRGHLHEGRLRAEGVLALPGSGDHPRALLGAHEAAGGLAYWQAQMDVARAHYDRTLALARQLGDHAAVANALYNGSFPLVFPKRNGPEADSDRRQAAAMIDEALGIYRSSGDKQGIAKALWTKTQPEYFGGDVQDKRALLDECLALHRETGDRFGLGWVLHTSGGDYRKSGKLAEAGKEFLEALEIFAEAGDISGVTLTLDDIARLNVDLGRVDVAVRLAGAAARLSRSSGIDLATLVNEMEGQVEAGGRLTPEATAAAWAAGQAMDFAQAVAAGRASVA
jgi:predicted ATPase/class 3 adenylate cyclase